MQEGCLEVGTICHQAWVGGTLTDSVPAAHPAEWEGVDDPRGIFHLQPLAVFCLYEVLPQTVLLKGTVTSGVYPQQVCISCTGAAEPRALHCQDVLFTTMKNQYLSLCRFG